MLIRIGRRLTLPALFVGLATLAGCDQTKPESGAGIGPSTTGMNGSGSTGNGTVANGGTGETAGSGDAGTTGR